MVFIVYSQVSERKLSENLGMPEYSYYFVLRGFLPVLQELGKVVTVRHPEEEVDAIYDDCLKRGEACVFITFSPPNKSATGLRCPTLCVLAWEFDRIPDEIWDNDPKNDWRVVFADHKRAITLSRYSTDAVKRAMGRDFPVASIPVPVWDAFEAYRKTGIHSGLSRPREITLNGNIIDSRQYAVTLDSIALIEPVENFNLQNWAGEPLRLGCRMTDDESAYLGGFYESEPWGTWSRIEQPWMLLPYRLSGDVQLKIRARGYGANIGRAIRVSLGDATGSITLADDFTDMSVDFRLTQPEHVLKFSGLDLSPPVNAPDSRTMGIGLCSVEVSGHPDDNFCRAVDVTKNDASRLSLDGIVYTSVFNPFDDRKNWTDMIKAFCAAFHNEQDATLVLKMTHRSVTSFLGKWHYLLQQLGPFKCRVVILHGYLDDHEYEHLIAASHYYVNASRCEGLCLPLMEFMSCGKPAVAPCNTSLADYVADDATFIVRSNVEPGIWPHDPRGVLRALRYRIDWESLMNAYRQSYDLAKHRPDAYRAMAEAAEDKMKKYASGDVVKKQINDFLTHVF